MIHGEKIRALPENKGLGWLAWNLPTFLLFSSLVTAYFIVKKLTKTTKSTSIIINNQQKKTVLSGLFSMSLTCVGFSSVC